MSDHFYCCASNLVSIWGAGFQFQFVMRWHSGTCNVYIVSVHIICLYILCVYVTSFLISQGARGTYHAPPPPPHQGTFHYCPKMYLRVSRTQSHLFPGQPLRCTGIIDLCARVPSCLQSVPDRALVTNASFKSLVHYYFVI